LDESHDAGRRAFLHAAVVGGLASTVAASSPGLTRAAQQPPALPSAGILVNVRDHGVRGDGSTDDTDALQDLIDSLGPREDGVAGARIYFPPGEYVISDTLVFRAWSGIVEGGGLGNSPSYSSPGQASVIRWDGRDDRPMIRLDDYRFLKITGLRLEGRDGSPPTYAIESSIGRGGGRAGTNAHLIVDNVHIGGYPWSTQGAGAGAVRAGIGFTGDNANNDEFQISNVTIAKCEVGVDLPNSQSIWGTLNNVGLDGATIAGIRTAASFTATNLMFNACAVDLELTSEATAVIIGHWSENSRRIIQARGTLGKALIYGGRWLLSPDITDGRFVYHDLCTAQYGISLCGVEILSSPDRPHPRIYMVGTGGGNGAGRLTMVDCLTSMTLSDFEVSSTPGNSLEVLIMSGSLFLHHRLQGEQSLASAGEGWGIDGPATLHEIDVPGPPSRSPEAKGAHLFVRDDGSGKTQLCVRFATGEVQVIAREP
jgi:hypothetical protein